MLDFHCHLLPGIDDGPETLEDAVAMARTLVQYGFVEVHCTPHCISGLYDNTPAIVKERLTVLQAALDRAGVSLLLRPGMEYYLDSRFPERLQDPLPLGESKLLLVEAPAWAGAEMVVENIQRILASGFVPLLAHPERWQLLSVGGFSQGLLARARVLFGIGEGGAAPDLLQQLQRMGCLFQGNLGSFAGRYGRLVEKRALAFLEAGIYSCLGSDSHPLPGLEEMLADGLDAVRHLSSDHQQLLDGRRLLL